MSIRPALVVLVAVSASAAVPDFQRDVQPIFQKNCIGCHGPEQQMNSFRLDRKSIAFRGGTRTVIIPGSSASSRLYLRVAGNTQFGNRMPPTGPLKAEEVAVIKAWIDGGAPWPEALANEVNRAPADPRVVRVAEALRMGLPVNIAADLLNARGPEGSTLLMYAALYGSTDQVKDLIAKGAEVNKRNDAGVTALMWAVPDVPKMRALIEHGADVNVRSLDNRTALVIAATQAGNAPAVKLLLDRKAEPLGLREAAAAGDAEMMRLLIDRGANIRAAGAGVVAQAFERDCDACLHLVEKAFDAKAFTRALLDVAVYAEPRAVKSLIDHGADVNAHDEDQRTPLLFAANSNKLPLETVKLLIEHGANVNAKNSDGWTPLYLAKLHGETPVVEALVKAGAKFTADPAPVLTPVTSNNPRAAVERALPLVQRADIEFTKKSGCTSCHNEGLTGIALGAAHKAGFHIDGKMAADEATAIMKFWSEWKERLLQGNAPGGAPYTLVGLEGMGYKPDFTTDAIAREIRMKQFSDGHWGYGCGGSRAPLCGAEISNTALAIRALQLYTPQPWRAEFDKQIQLAGKWLMSAQSHENEDFTFRVLGLTWAGAAKSDVAKAVRELAANQSADGGWSDIPSMPTTAFATAQALVALHHSGMAISDPVWQKGMKFLLATQLTDGSWYVKTHSLAVQPYFDVGFPHGHDQWISASATNWAITALSLASTSSTSQVDTGLLHSPLR
jgi:ankyrin repeat protein